MSEQHQYSSDLEWTGNTGAGYSEYDRSHVVRIAGKPEMRITADPTFLGDPLLHNPEDLLLASLSSCHMLTYLALCARARIVVTHYSDAATGVMITPVGGQGRFTEVTLHPRVTVADESMIAKALELHDPARKYCFIANSVNFPVRHEAVCGVHSIGHDTIP